MSNQPTIPLNLPVADPDLATVLAAWKQDIMRSTNCHALATITAFSQDTSSGRFKVNATINYSITRFVQQGDGTYAAQQVPYPQLLDCPAIVLGGGNTALQFPIAVGDQCLVLFNDRDIGNWWAGANTGPVPSARMHSLSDGIALVGFQHIGNLDTSHASLTNGNAKVGVGASGSLVQLENNSTSLNTLLGDLMSALTTFMTAAGTATTVAQVATAATTCKTALNAIDFGSLLE
jgi:hypothetical protein